MRKKNVDSFAIVYSNTFLDKIAVKFYNDTGVKTRCIRDDTFTRGCELGVYDDLIIQVHHPPEIAREMDEFYFRIRRLEDVNLVRLSELAKRNVPIKVSVFKNAEMANQIRQSFLRHFPPKKVPASSVKEKK
jgi:hypothetical protein